MQTVALEFFLEPANTDVKSYIDIPDDMPVEWYIYFSNYLEKVKGAKNIKTYPIKKYIPIIGSIKRITYLNYNKTFANAIFDFYRFPSSDDICNTMRKSYANAFPSYKKYIYDD